MDDFFEISNSIAEPSRSHEPDEPPWIHPPRDVIAGLVSDRRVIARTDRLVVILTHIDAFPTGAMFRFRIMGRRPNEMSESDWRDFHETIMGHRLHPGSTDAVPDELFRIGVQFPDGRKATNIAHAFGPHPRFLSHAPEEPSLVQIGGGGSGRPRSFAVGRSIWLWPLPPAD